MTLHQPLTREDLHNIIEGAAFLGSGGGGPLELARPLIDYMAEHDLWPKVVSFDQMHDGHVGMVAGLGSPAAASGSHSAFTRAPVRLIRLMEKLTGNNFQCLIPGETGPMNSLIPLLVGAQRGIPVLDADGAGRAMSTLAMSTFNAAAPVRPFVLGNEPAYNSQPITAQLSLGTPEQADTMSRAVVTASAFGSVGAFSTWPSTVQALSRVAVRNSLSLSHQVGAVLRQCQQEHTDPLEPLQALPALVPRLRRLYTGLITSVEIESGGGFDRMTVRLGEPGDQLTLMGLNENMIAWYQGSTEPVCMGPDSLCYVTTDGQAFSNASVRDIMQEGRKVHVIGLKADGALQTPDIQSAYARVLAQLGYAGQYRPLTIDAPVSPGS